MAATRDKYQPPQFSERWYTPYITCSLVSWVAAETCSTLGESVTWGTGALFGKPALKNRLKRAWEEIRADGDRGYGRTDFNAFMRALGSPIRLSEVKFTKDRESILNALGKDHVITMAGNTRGCRPNSPIRTYVGEADHRIMVKGLRTYRGQQQTRLYEPMTPDTDARHWGRWIPVQDLFDFGKRYKHWGLFHAERFLTGHHTREAKARRNGAKAVLKVQEQVVALQEAVFEADKVIAKQEKDIVALKAQLEQQVDRQAILILAEDIRQGAQAIIASADELTQTVTVTPLRTG